MKKMKEKKLYIRGKMNEIEGNWNERKVIKLKC